ncbi:MAG: toxin-antitoxin system HicB family antitoxin [Acidimicrobiales bacterium]|nr:toxin-antitoxin system HicB family antitoxin [Acidimicrobiales bacterium]
MNLRGVPDEVHAALADAAAAARQSLNAYVVERLTELASAARLADYLAGYQAPTDSGVSLEEATAAVRELRKGS